MSYQGSFEQSLLLQIKYHKSEFEYHIIPLKHLNPVLKIYAENFNDSYLGAKMLDLIKLWCEDPTSAKALIDKFIPIAIKVFEEFYKNTSNKINNDFEQVKKTVMTEHSNPDIKTSSEMLPNLIDIITIKFKI